MTGYGNRPEVSGQDQTRGFSRPGECSDLEQWEGGAFDERFAGARGSVPLSIRRRCGPLIDSPFSVRPWSRYASLDDSPLTSF